MKHLVRLFVSTLAVVLALLNIADPLGQLTIACIAFLVGVCGTVVVVLRAKRDKTAILTAIEGLMFIAAISFAFRALVDIGTHFSQRQQ